MTKYQTRAFDKIKVILISNATMRFWVNLYETEGAKACKDYGFEIEPDELFTKLNVNTKILYDNN